MKTGRALVVLFALAAAGCGTALYEHRFEVTVNDPSGRLGTSPVDVSIFNKLWGYSEEWARRTMGVATATQPYSGTVTATATKWIVGDSSLPPGVVAGLALPALEKNGYFVVDIQPVPGTPKTATLAFAPYDSFFPEGNQVPPLAVRYESEAEKKGWRIRLTVDVPPK